MTLPFKPAIQPELWQASTDSNQISSRTCVVVKPALDSSCCHFSIRGRLCVGAPRNRFQLHVIDVTNAIFFCVLEDIDQGVMVGLIEGGQPKPWNRFISSSPQVKKESLSDLNHHSHYAKGTKLWRDLQPPTKGYDTAKTRFMAWC